MQNPAVISLCCVAVMISPYNARAEESQHQAPLMSASLSTLGVGLDVRIPITDHLSLTLAGNYIHLPENTIRFGQREAAVTMRSYGLGLSYQPFANGVFLEAGIKRNLNRLDFFGTFTEQGITAEYEGRVRFPDYAPYLAVGINTPQVDHGWQYGITAGVLWQGQPKAGITSDHPLAGLPAFQEVLEGQRRGALNHAEQVEFFPIVSLRATYRF